jgi:hydroxymethylbilane synthase
MAFALRIGSRPSALAMAQANLIKDRLEGSVAGLRAEIVSISTTGDKLTTPSLAQVGGKGLFIRELEQALGDGRIDIAVHSMKDLPAVLPGAFRIAAIPQREDPRDALITRNGGGWDALAAGARIGTSSPRRRLEVLRLRPDFSVIPLRGNVDTRLKRLEAGDFDAIVVAMAGLIRLERRAVANPIELDDENFVPAGGQGALAIEALAGSVIGASPELESAIAALNDLAATAEVTAERSFLATIGASCVSPVGIKGSIEGDSLRLRALLFSLDGTRSLVDQAAAAHRLPASPGKSAQSAKAMLEAATELGALLGRRMLAQGADEMIRP